MFRYAVTQFMQCFSRLSLDPIDRTPLQTPHEIYTTWFDLLLFRVKHCFETG